MQSTLKVPMLAVNLQILRKFSPLKRTKFCYSSTRKFAENYRKFKMTEDLKVQLTMASVWGFHSHGVIRFWKAAMLEVVSGGGKRRRYILVRYWSSTSPIYFQLWSLFIDVIQPRIHQLWANLPVLLPFKKVAASRQRWNILAQVSHNFL